MTQDKIKEPLRAEIQGQADEILRSFQDEALRWRYSRRRKQKPQGVYDRRPYPPGYLAEYP